MKIVIDLQACQSASRLGGIGRYSMALAKAMARCAGGHEIYLLLNQLMPQAEIEIGLEFADLLPPQQIVTFSVCGPVAARQSSNRSRKKIAELLREEFLRKMRPDMVHVASHVEGWGDDVVTSIENRELAAKTAVTWYDLIPYVQPEMYLSDPAVAAHYYSKVEEVKRAGLLLAISQHSRDEAIRILGLDDERVVNISSAVDNSFQRIHVCEATLRKLRTRFGIDRPFLLYTGSFDARKNQSRLIQAFAQLPAEIRDQYQLVIAGNGWKEVYDQLREVGRAAGLAPTSLVFAGRVSDDELVILYNACRLFVFPSLSEGFGLPVLEAMACGAPTIGSNCTSLPEVVGRSDALFDPRRAESISRKIYEVLTDDNFRRALIAHGDQHCRKFTWESAARRALSAFEQHHATGNRSTARGLSLSPIHLHEPEAGDDMEDYHSLIHSIAEAAHPTDSSQQNLEVVAQCIASNELMLDYIQAETADDWVPRVGWVTTWGSRCGIASYSKLLIDSLPLPVTVVLAEQSCPDGETLDMPVVACWKAGEEDSLIALSNQADAYDLDLVVVQVNYGFFNFAALNHFVESQVARGRNVILTLHSTTDPPKHVMSKSLSELSYALNACDRVLVHSERDVARLAQLGIVNNVSICPHGVQSADGGASLDDAKPKAFTLASYGFFLPHKGILELIEAFNLLADADPELHLNLVNAEYSPDASGALIRSARRRIAEAKLDSRVSMFTDYLDDADSLALLTQADLIIFPYQHTGESSSAAVRTGLASGRPVAVTPLAIFDDVSSSVLRLPGCRSEELAKGIRELVVRIRSGNDQELLALEERSKAWRKRTSVQRVSIQLSHLIRRLAATSPRCRSTLVG